MRGRRRLGGSIPACAGEPKPVVGPMWNGRVYPRACGGTAVDLKGNQYLKGLSPRVRGNRSRTRYRRPRWGSIPARAGEPLPAEKLSKAQEVYPRACGGTILSGADLTDATGLSPRVRGNRRLRACACLGVGSIPARAGEPCNLDRFGGLCWVYPRACGGTASTSAWSALSRGLSPRVRGNPHHERDCLPGRGSIPARAGEPPSVAAQDLRFGVYPRACGGTGPPTVPGGLMCTWVYPRACGGTVADSASARVMSADQGSIPARAGEPALGIRAASTRSRVYPRACGGTCGRRPRGPARCGLSPRVRGNPTPCRRSPTCPRYGLSPRVRGNLCVIITHCCT